MQGQLELAVLRKRSINQKLPELQTLQKLSESPITSLDQEGSATTVELVRTVRQPR